MIEVRPDQLDAQKLRQTLVLHHEPEAPKAPSAAPTFQALQTAKEDEFAPIRVGGRVDGYAVVDNLAEGGMGAVYRVKDRQGDRDLALKAPLPDGRGGSFEHRMKRFLREVRLTSRMDDPGVAKVVEVGQQDGLPYFTMELVDGTPLSERMYDGPMPIGEACEIIVGAARAVHHIHGKNVIHRDLKPQNILVKRSGEVVIIDFGLARDAGGIDPRITQSGVWLGTPAYIAPEQAQGEASKVDARADVWSLAAVLYEALTGRAPYGNGQTRQIFKNLRAKNAEPIRFHRPEVPEAIDRVIMKALSKERTGRQASAKDFADELEAALEAHKDLPALQVNSSVETPVTDLDALESIPVDLQSPILRAKKSDKSGRAGDKSDRALKLEKPEKPELGFADMTVTAPIDVVRAPLADAKRKGTGTEKKVRAVEGKHHSKRLRELRRMAAERRGLLVLGGPALLALCGLLLLLL